MGSRIPCAVLLAAMVLAVAGCGSDDGSGGEESAENDVPALFDASVVHTIEVEFDQEDYDAMISTFTETGEKESIEASVTIDGVTYERVGLRLKGNSSLAGLGGGFGPGGGGGRAANGEAATSGEDGAPTDGPEPPDGPRGGSGPGGGFGAGGGASAEEPEQLPWLIELDEFVDQSHDGYEDIVIRSNSSETSLNEAVALDLLEEAGLASQEAVATSFTVNGSASVLRLAIEHPDDDAWYERAFDDAEGALYKAESTGDWSYRGDDPDAYDEVFDQEGGDDVADLTPLIEFLEFIDESDDETFASELPERLDVESFATYLAMMDLLGNFDDIDGPGNNAYLWWDAETEQFTVVPWDMNLAFSASGGIGQGQPGGGGQPPEGFEPGELPEGFDPDDLPEGFEPPEGFEGLEPGELPDGFDPQQGPGGGGGFGGRTNALVERFHANAEFDAIYEEKLVELRSELFDSDVADEILDTWVETLNTEAAGLIDGDTVAAEAEAIREQFGD